MRSACRLCESTRHRTVFEEFGIPILACTSCGHVYSSYETDQNYEGYYGETVLAEADLSWQDSAHDAMYGEFGRKFLEGRAGRLLDVGSGLGFFLRYATRFPSWEAHGVEISPAAVAFARERLQLKNLFQGRLEDAPFPKRHFDLVTLFDVVEHLPDARPLLKAARRLLKDDGVLFLHTPNIWFQLPKARVKKLLFGMKPGRHYLEAKDHVNIYSPRTMERLLVECGFKRLRFLHLPPIEGVAGDGSLLARGAKSFFGLGTRTLALATLGKVNLDNLFVEARQ